MIRYRTRDICVLDRSPCPCGRTLVKMSKPRGRTDDMLIIRGVNVFPSQIEEVLLKVSGENITPNYQIIVGRENNTDTLDINVEMSEKMFSDDIRSVEKLEKEIVSKLRSMLGIGAKVHLVNPKTIARARGQSPAHHRQPETVRRQTTMLIKQISVFVENVPGKLVEVSQILGTTASI